MGGYFTTIGDQAVDRLARLNPDGSLDASFSTPTINSFVRFITLQPDGKILIGGEFTSVGGEEHKYIARLLPDGDVDSEFTASISTSELYAIAVQDNGKILVGGLFGLVNNGSYQPCSSKFGWNIGYHLYRSNRSIWFNSSIGNSTRRQNFSRRFIR